MVPINNISATLPFNEVELWWVLHNDGCYYMYKVVVMGGLLEFWTALNYSNYIGTTKMCVYTNDEMDNRC
ncbi:MAG TPA: hypothetical protein PKD90_13195 [Phnomibacter sp.]|nr:hypothetical protein [Phnomibacter sp.]